MTGQDDSKQILKKVTLDNVAGGVAAELFEREIQEIALNINDHNTSAIAKRKITMTFEFTPDAERREVAVLIGAKSALAPVRPMKHTIFCGRIDGLPQMLGTDPSQMELDLNSVDVAPIIRKPYKEEA